MKPLLVLSAAFVVTAVAGLAALDAAIPPVTEGLARLTEENHRLREENAELRRQLSEAVEADRRRRAGEPTHGPGPAAAPADMIPPQTLPVRP